MINIVCVLKTGGDFTSIYVEKLFNACKRNITNEDFYFACLSDDEEVKNMEGVNFIELEYKYPGWWSKFEVFRITGKTIYFDLDTVIMGDLSDMICLVKKLKPSEFLGISAFNPIRNQNAQTQLGSGVMGWNGDFRFIMKQFDFHRD